MQILGSHYFSLVFYFVLSQVCTAAFRRNEDRLIFNRLSTDRLTRQRAPPDGAWHKTDSAERESEFFMHTSMLKTGNDDHSDRDETILIIPGLK